MNNKPTPSDMTMKIIAASQVAETVADLPTPGTIANEYGESIKGDLTPENVEAFLHGTSVMGLLVQEAIIRSVKVATTTEAEDKIHAAYLAGAADSARVIARIMAMVSDGVIAKVVEGPITDREFQQIIQNF